MVYICLAEGEKRPYRYSPRCLHRSQFGNNLVQKSVECVMPSGAGCSIGYLSVPNISLLKLFTKILTLIGADIAGTPSG